MSKRRKGDCPRDFYASQQFDECGHCAELNNGSGVWIDLFHFDCIKCCGYARLNIDYKPETVMESSTNSIKGGEITTKKTLAELVKKRKRSY